MTLSYLLIHECQERKDKAPTPAPPPAAAAAATVVVIVVVIIIVVGVVEVIVTVTVRVNKEELISLENDPTVERIQVEDGKRCQIRRVCIPFEPAKETPRSDANTCQCKGAESADDEGTLLALALPIPLIFVQALPHIYGTHRYLPFFNSKRATLTFLLPLTTCKSTNYDIEIIPSLKFNSSEKISSPSLTIDRFSRGTVTDIVSKNITMVLENLLMNYENSQLPTHGKGRLIIANGLAQYEYYMHTSNWSGARCERRIQKEKKIEETIARFLNRISLSNTPGSSHFWPSSSISHFPLPTFFTFFPPLSDFLCVPKRKSSFVILLYPRKLYYIKIHRNTNGGKDQYSDKKYGSCFRIGYGLLNGLLLSTILA
uniref:Uncharacterized protein n=1 Tax=Vespula pensylvanica TaxID=30213 RepID=A0A834UG49_VESPE|nr:hypothetical protein H0235_000471 [Vespula pensylvanica]